MMIEVFPVEYKKIRNRGQEETSSEMRKKIREARTIQKERFLNTGILLNAEMNQKQTECFCVLQKEAEEVLHSLFETNEFSTRRYYRILKLSRTIADLESCELIEKRHLIEAFSYCNIGKKYWRVSNE